MGNLHRVRMYYPLALAIVILFVYRITASKKRIEIFYLLAFLLVGFLLSFYENADIGVVLLGVLIFNTMASTYGSMTNYAFFAIAAAYVLLFSGSPILISQSMFLGFLSRAYAFIKQGSVGSVRNEERRDLVQIAIGAVLISILVLAGGANYAYATLFLMFGILLGSLLSNFALLNTKGRAWRFLQSLERKKTVFGQGAMWLTLGFLAAISFVDSRAVVVVLSAIFIGDAVATIIGMRYGKATLFYNRKKTRIGSIAYFAVTLVVSFPFIGYVAILTSFVAALVESLPKHLDDNFDTAVVLVILIKLLDYAGLI